MKEVNEMIIGLPEDVFTALFIGGGVTSLFIAIVLMIKKRENEYNVISLLSMILFIIALLIMNL